MPGRLSRKRRASDNLEEHGEDEASQLEQGGRAQASRAATEDLEDDDGPSSSTSLDDLAKRLVRLALAHESQRRPLRRQDISDKVLGSGSRQFKKVFAQAQHELRTVFSMELVELPARDKLTVAQRRAAQQKTNGPKSQTTAWVLASILPQKFQMPAILQPSAIPNSSSEGTYTGLYSILVALVSLSGGMLAETRLDRYLSRLGLAESTPLQGAEKPEQLLKRMEKDGYLVKVREKIGVSGEEEISWALGPRAKVEVGVKALVETVYDLSDEQDKTDLVKKLDRSLGLAEHAQASEV